MGRGVSQDYKIIQDGQIPLWVQGKNPENYSGHFSDLNNMTDSLGACYKMLDNDKELQKIIVNYTKSMGSYTKSIMDGVELRQERILELQKEGLVWSSLTRLLLFKIENMSK
jgi:hypothetical protein